MSVQIEKASEMKEDVDIFIETEYTYTTSYKDAIKYKYLDKYTLQNLYYRINYTFYYTRDNTSDIFLL
jgi:hypothetical protein